MQTPHLSDSTRLDLTLHCQLRVCGIRTILSDTQSSKLKKKTHKSPKPYTQSTALRRPGRIFLSNHSGKGARREGVAVCGDKSGCTSAPTPTKLKRGWKIRWPVALHCQGRQNTSRVGKEWPAPSVPSVPEEKWCPGSFCTLVDSPSLAAVSLSEDMPRWLRAASGMGEHNWNCSGICCIFEKTFLSLSWP